MKSGPSVYLASRYARRPELLEKSGQLRKMGISVTSRWLRGDYELPNVPEQDPQTREMSMDTQPLAIEDMEDIRRADIVVVFTEQPLTIPSHGGRHVELGIALASRKRIIIVGPRENVFCTLEQVETCPDWQSALSILAEAKTRTPAAYPMWPKKAHRYDWRLQPVPESAAEDVGIQLAERWNTGIRTYGPYFSGDPFDHNDQELHDAVHYSRAGRRQRDAYRLALTDILNVIGSNPKDPTAKIKRIARLALSQEQNTPTESPC